MTIGHKLKFEKYLAWQSLPDIFGALDLDLPLQALDNAWLRNMFGH